MGIEVTATITAIWGWVSGGIVSAGPIGTAAFLISSILAWIKISETMRDRVRLTATFFWTGQEGAPDTITVANLGARPVLVSYWQMESLRRFAPWSQAKDETPDYDPDADLGFRLDPHTRHKIEVDDDDKVDHGSFGRRERTLYLKLFLYGRARPLRLKLT